ncbi:MAG TPA: cytochrome b5 domain-containing protein, partial [Desulfobacterales bacterium]|nr:cytochrome b5 domain-containing protein [Desulfobacterales bacterium]
MKEFTLEDLARYNGENGNPVYIAHAGKVYDVSASKMWKTGTHMKRHRSGQDLTPDIQAAPHTVEVLGRYPQVGVLKTTQESVDPRLPGMLVELYKHFPFL